jgi:chaperonin GroEL
MSVKQVLKRSEVTNATLAGIEVVDWAVGGTIGPEGTRVAIQSSYGPPKVTKDGMAVAESIELKDPGQNMAGQIVIEAARGTMKEAGDGKTTAIILAVAIARQAIKRVVSGMDPMGISRGIRKAVDAVVIAIKNMAKPCTDSLAIEQVGTISANGDSAIGKMIASAVEQVGKDGVIMVQEGDGVEDVLELQSGMQYDRGYLARPFITNPQEDTAELDNPYILVVDKKISNMLDIRPILEKVVSQNRALLIIAENVEGDALTLLILNRLRGVAKVCAVKAPGFGDNSKAILEDIAVFTKATVISEKVGLNVENADIEHLGNAKRVVVTQDSFTIMDGIGDQTAVEAHVTMLKKLHDKASSSYEKEKKQERLAKLSGGIGVIKVGAPAELEMKEKKARLEDALSATRAAIEEGIVPGGGVALLRAAKVLDDLKGDNADEDAGISIIRDSITAPLYRIIQNTGREPAVIAHNIMHSEEGKSNINYGYNAAKDIYGDMVEMGIIDPTKVERIALQKGASAASMLINVQCMITELPKEESTQNGGMGAGMNGMGGMDMM